MRREEERREGEKKKENNTIRQLLELDGRGGRGGSNQGLR